MLPKEQKVSKKLFDEVFKGGKNYHSDFLFLKLKKLDKPDEKSHFAVVASKKIFQKAIGRILIKRKIFAVLRENKNLIKTGSAGVFFVKKGIEDLKPEEIKKEVNLLLKNSRLFTEDL